MVPIRARYATLVGRAVILVLPAIASLLLIAASPVEPA